MGNGVNEAWMSSFGVDSSYHNGISCGNYPLFLDLLVNLDGRPRSDRYVALYKY